jgi:transposase
MIRIDAVWLATEPLDKRAEIDSALARVVNVFGAAHPHTAYLFANRRANRMKVLVHDGIGFLLAARRPHLGHFVWPAPQSQAQVNLSRPKLDALVLDLPWSRIGEGGIITVV